MIVHRKTLRDYLVKRKTSVKFLAEILFEAMGVEKPGAAIDRIQKLKKNSRTSFKERFLERDCRDYALLFYALGVDPNSQSIRNLKKHRIYPPKNGINYLQFLEAKTEKQCCLSISE